MSDIVERLRDPSAFPDTIKADCAEAANEIERLRKDYKLLRRDWETVLALQDKKLDEIIERIKKLGI